MTVNDIISEALEQLGVLAAGEFVSAVDQATCLNSFKNMIRSLPGFGLGGGLTDVVVTSSPYTASANERILWVGVGDLSLTLPQLIEGNAPKNGDRVAVTSGGNTGVYVYIAATANWLDVNAITGNTDDPLGPDCNQALCDMLACRVARKFSVPMTQEISMAKDIAERTIAARFAPDMTQVTDPALWSYWNNFNGALT